MTGPEERRVKTLQANDYATIQDFCSAFGDGQNELYQLAFLLTADRQMEEHCFVAGLEESDCALFLDCSPRQLEGARVRAVTQFTGRTAPMR